MADTEILAARVGTLRLERPKRSKPIQQIIKAIAGRLVNLILGSSEPLEPIEKARSILMTRIDAVVNIIINLVYDPNRPPLFPEPPKVAGMKRLIDGTVDCPEEPERKRRHIVPESEVSLHDFEEEQRVYGDVYIPLPKHRRYGVGRVREVYKWSDWKYVEEMSPTEKSMAYQTLLKDAGLRQIPYYRALLMRYVKETQNDIAWKLKQHSFHLRKWKRHQHALRIFSSLEQRAIHEASTACFHREIGCAHKGIERESTATARLNKDIRRLRIPERGFLGSVSTFFHPSMPFKSYAHNLYRSKNATSA